MGQRVAAAYRERFRTLLARVKPRRLEFGVELLLGRAAELARREEIPLLQALGRVYEATRVRVEKRVALMAACSVAPPETLPSAAPRFVCDANLGALARWLRAAGYEAEWEEGIEDGRLVERARATAAVVLTGDVGVLKRRAVSRGEVRAVFVPSPLSRMEQLGLVLRELGLPRRPPRCMACGGALQPVSKDEVRERIPPRTARWKDAYFTCGGCGRLFWEGTHWERIQKRLSEAAASA
jgi:uncharacterized protein with PIN domain